jgi:cold shock CspA family protein/ribosome-associated translation inhibitor RaiA
MQRDPIVSWHGIPASPAVEAIVRKRLSAVARLAPQAVGCRVTLSAEQGRHRSARGFETRIHLDMPGPDIDVARAIRHGHAADDLVRSVNAAFGALEARLKESRRVLRGQEVKHHAPVLHGEIVELEAGLGYGFVRADDGREVYFQKDGLVAGTWDELELGGRLRFRELEGEKGAYAVDVAPA